MAVVVPAALLAAGVWLVSAHRAAREEQAFEALRQRLAGMGGSPQDHHHLGLRLAERGEQDESLAHLELAAAAEPGDLRLGNDLRMSFVRFGRYDRSIAFFERLMASHPGLGAPRLQTALSYIDKMPDHMMGIVGQGRLSKQSIALLGRLLEDAPREEALTWSTHYALGMNHLYWPRALGHAPLAVQAFERCLDFIRQWPGASRECRLLPRICLGDALVKAGEPGRARRIWREALQDEGEDPRLSVRLELEDDAALSHWVDETRGLGVVVDTDLSVLWRP